MATGKLGFTESVVESPMADNDTGCERKPGGRSDSEFEKAIRDTCLHLAELEQKKLGDLLVEYEDVFVDKSGRLGHTDVAPVHINLKPVSIPYDARAYPASPAHFKVIDDYIGTMLEQGIIEESDSMWAAPVVLVRKKDNTACCCIDYHRLNQMIIPNAYPLPRIDDLLTSLGTAKLSFASSLDLCKGFLQLELAKESRHLTAFITHRGLFSYRRLPMGLCISPTGFQRALNTILHSVMPKYCLVYMDDVIVYSSGDFDNHLEALAQGFSMFQGSRLENETIKV